MKQALWILCSTALIAGTVGCSGGQLKAETADTVSDLIEQFDYCSALKNPEAESACESVLELAAKIVEAVAEEEDVDEEVDEEVETTTTTTTTTPTGEGGNDGSG